MKNSLFIVCIHGPLAGPLRTLGHTVEEIRPGPGFFDLEWEIKNRGFEPDLIVQVETLGPRTLLQGLDRITCPKIFWSIDTHLNLYWQGHYARLFDLVLTTQKHWIEALKREGVQEVQWLPWYGLERQGREWRARNRRIGFVGRVTAHRAARGWFVRFLRDYPDFSHEQEVPFSEMCALYDNTRIAPNESILGEINFRTFEAASSGCAVLNPAIDEGLEELFVPGREIMIHSHVVELKSQIDFLLKNDHFAEKMGRAARQRVLLHHLPVHRALTLVERVSSISAGTRKSDADRDLLLAAHQLFVNSCFGISAEVLKKYFSALEPCPKTLSALLSLYHMEGVRESLMQLITLVLHQGLYTSDLALNVSCSAACMCHGELALARQFWYRYAKDKGKKGFIRPESMKDMYILWAEEFGKQKRFFRPGFQFDPKQHLPGSAAECLLMVLGESPEDLKVTSLLDRLVARFRGMEAFHLQLLSYRSLQNLDNWRLGLELALTNLRAYRLHQGLEELMLAYDCACNQKQQHRFMRVLSEKDSSGLIKRMIFPENRCA